MLSYLGMCVYRTRPPDEDYLSRPEVQELLSDLRRERPENLNTWLRGYISQRDKVFTPDASYDMLDWRFFILNKEKEVAEISRKLTSTQAKKRQVGRIQCESWEKEAHLHAYLPRIIKDSINAGLISFDDQQLVLNTTPTTPLSCAYNPIIASFDAAVVFMDASGFTVLTETLATLPQGAEHIGACLNQFFGPIIEKVVKHGGDILKFSGDAIMIVWPIKEAQDGSMTEDELGRALEATSTASTMAATLSGHCEFSNPLQAVTAACKCCLEVQREVGQVGKTPVDGVTLTLHCGVGFGNLNLLQLGGLLDRWEYCAAGTAIEGATAAEPLGKPDGTVLSPSVVEVLKLSETTTFNTSPLGPEKRGNEGFVKLLDKADMVLNGGSAPARRRSGSLLSESEKRFMDPCLVKRFIPETVRRAVRRAVHVSDTLDEAEMRRIAVIFLGVEGLVPKDPTDEESVSRWAARTQLMMRHFQRSVYALEGSINKFVVDDKGMVLLVVFGLPPVSHFNDDPVRAVLTATRLCDTLYEEGMHGRAGVATGRCWCGVVGTDFRQEYTVLGDVVNLAARLMSKAGQNTVLVEQATHDACQKYLKFESLGECKVKGKVKQVNVFQFTGQLSSNWTLADRRIESQLMSWADWPAKAQIYDALEAQLKHEAGPGGVVYVQGRWGCGKREAVAHIERWAKSKNFSVLAGQNMNPTSTFAVPRLCWQEVFGRLLEAACLDPHWQVPMNSAKPATSACIQLYQLVLAMLTAAGAEKELLHWAPLLSFVLPGINFGAKGVSALLERDEQRSSGPPRLALLCSLLLESFTASNSVCQGTVVLVHIKRGSSVYHESYVHDDNIAHAIAELAVNRRTRANGRPLIFCIVSRHGQVDKWLPSQADLLHGMVKMGDLNREATECFMGHLLETDSVDTCLVDWVYDSCAGNVYAIEALTRQLGTFEALHRTDEGGVELSDGTQLRDVPYPEELLGTALQGFEQLDLAAQHLLKAAAVFCQEQSDGIIMRKVFTPLALAGYAGRDWESDVEAIEEKCLQLVDIRIFAEVPAGHRSTRSSASSVVSFEENDNPCLRFRFVSDLILYVASTLVLEVQRKKILERADTASRRSQRKTCSSQRLATMTEDSCG